MSAAWKATLGAVLLVGSAGLPAVSVAQSGTAPGPWMGGRMDTNLYIGANIGQSRFRTACDDVPVACDDKDVGGRLYGGYQFHRHFAVEAGYFRLGEANASGAVGGGGFASATAEVSGWELLGVALFPITNEFSLFGKLGVARSRVEVSGSAVVPGFAVTLAAKDRSTDLTFGLGAQYAFTRNIAARLEWQRYNDVGGDSTGKDDLDLFSAGVLFRF